MNTTDDRILNIGGVAVRVLDRGQGAPLLILHGWGSSIDRWSAVIDGLVGAGYRVIMPDLPGFGASAEPPADWDVSAYVDWTRALIDALQLSAYAILAHSFGGRVAIKFAAGHPPGLRRLVLCGAAGIRRDDWPVRLKRAVFGTAARVGKSVAGAQGPLRQLLYKFARERDYAQASERMRGVMRLALAEDLRDALPHIAVPTLLIWGAADRATPLRDGELMAARIPQAELRVLPGVGHGVHRQAAPELVQWVTGFLAE